jgi:hypothetical protein
MSDVVEVIARALCRKQWVDASCAPPEIEACVNREWKDFDSEARSVLSAIRSAGYAIVPKEPTREMADAAYARQDGLNAPRPVGLNYSAVYETMIAAAPKVI